MRKRILILLAAAGLVNALPAWAETQTVTLTGFNGTELGQVNMEYGEEGIVLRVTLKGMSEGWHGFHIHEKGDCSAADFSSAGGHAMMAGEEHGAKDAVAMHMGDMPNIHIDSVGNGAAEVILRGVTQSDLADADGSAFVVHERADDYRTDPSGDSGGRVACGVIVPAQE